MDDSIHSVLNEKNEDATLEKFLNIQIEDWKAKMVKVYGDQYPYTFYVTAGHDFEDLILNISDWDACAREVKKREPFENLAKMCEVDRQAQQNFFEILSEIENEKPTLELKEELEEKKKECAKVFKMFDEIVTVCEEYFKLEYSDCSARVSKQMAFHKPVIDEVGKFLTELEEFGNAEIKSLRERISNWIFGKGLSMLDNVNKSYCVLNDQPFALEMWSKCTDALTSKDIRQAFLTDQKELSHLWKKAFDDLLILSAKLEKCRCDYNLTKFKLEREIFWMNRDYKENMPELTKLQRHLAALVDQKAALKSEMKNLEKETVLEQKRLAEVQNKMKEKILSTKANNKFAHQTALKKFQNVLQTKKEEVFYSLCEVLKGDQFIYEEILSVAWNQVDVSHLKPENVENDKLEEFKEDASVLIPENNFSAAFVDDFSRGYNALISGENFMTLLNRISDELGYMLDLPWVNYVKEKLQLTQEVKWNELFKVFKVNLEELKDLKEHMIAYCQFGDDGEVAFKIDSAVDGFLNFIWQKRQVASTNGKQQDFEGLQDVTNYWISVKKLIPKPFLWDNVDNVLFEYWNLLEERNRLSKRRLSLITENEEYENYLKNYRKFGTGSV